MSCFLACFGASKHNNGHKSSRKSPPDDPNVGDQRCKTVSVIDVGDKEDDSEKRVDLVADSPVKQPVMQPSLTGQAKSEEQFSSGARKKVTFDSNIKEYNHVCVDEIGVNHNSIELDKSPSLSESGSTVSTLGLYPPNHRYRNCRESDDDEEELDDIVSDLDEDADGEDEDEDEDGHDEDTLSNSLTPEMKIKGSGFNHGVRDRAGYIHSVMNPIENTSQWRRVKSKGTSIPKEKENFVVGSVFEPKSKNDLVVDASLSNWLVSTQRTSMNTATPVELEPISSGASVCSNGSSSVMSRERLVQMGQVLGAPSGSPDEKPLVGTVGVHWNDRTPSEEFVSTSSIKGIPNTTSKYREDRKVNWHSTPFEKRLERALHSGSAEAYAAHRVYK